MLKPSIYKAFYNNYKDYIISKELYKYKNIGIKEYIYNFKLFGKIVAVVFVALVATNFIGGNPPERTIIMKIMTQDKTRVLNFKMTYISYVKGISAEAREDILVQAFLTCPNISEISKKTKIPRPTIYTVIHSDSFQRKYSEARNEAVTGAIAYLQGKLGECAAVLVNTATDTEVPAQIRVNAANAALSQCSQWTKNVDMIERLEAMEELMSRVEQEQKLQKRKK